MGIATWLMGLDVARAVVPVPAEQLIGPVPPSTNWTFASEVDLYEDILVVSDPWASNADTYDGEIYIFDAATGAQVLKVVGTAFGGEVAELGRSVSAAHDAVGATGLLGEHGLWVRDDAGSWTQYGTYQSPSYDAISRIWQPYATVEEGLIVRMGIGPPAGGWLDEQLEIYSWDRDTPGVFTSLGRLDAISGMTVASNRDTIATFALAGVTLRIYEADPASATGFAPATTLTAPNWFLGDTLTLGDGIVGVVANDDVALWERQANGDWSRLPPVPFDSASARVADIALVGDRRLLIAQTEWSSFPTFVRILVFDRDLSGAWVQTATLEHMDAALDMYAQVVGFENQVVAYRVRAGYVPSWTVEPPDRPWTVDTEDVALTQGGAVTLGPSTITADDAEDDPADLRVEVVEGPSTGSLRLDGVETTSFTIRELSDGRVEWVQDGSYAVRDTLDFRLYDPAGNPSILRTLYADIEPIFPTGEPDTWTAPADVPLVVAAPGVLANDGPSAIVAELDRHPDLGEVTLEADGGFTWTPPAGYSGALTFAYVPTDGVQTGERVDVTVEWVAPSPPDEEPTAPAEEPDGPSAHDRDEQGGCGCDVGPGPASVLPVLVVAASGLLRRRPGPRDASGSTRK